jgi:cytochrome c biogenesis protein
VAIYQSSFEDGGSKLKLTGFPMAGTAPSASRSPAKSAAPPLKLGDDLFGRMVRFPALQRREHLGRRRRIRAREEGQESLEEQFAVLLDKHTGSAGKNANNKDLKNVGPSVQYKLRDKTGQAREYNNYMQPVTLEGARSTWPACAAIRPTRSASCASRPTTHGVTEWMRLRAALADPALREEAARRYAARATPQSSRRRAGAPSCSESPAKTLTIFAGDDKAGGFLAISQFLEKIPAGEQEKAAECLHEDAQRQPVGAVAGRARESGLAAGRAPTRTTAASCSWPPTRCRTASSTARRSTCNWTNSPKSRPRCCR